MRLLYNNFLYDATQYPDPYVSSLSDIKGLLKQVIDSAIISPNLIRIKNEDIVFDVLGLSRYLRNTTKGKKPKDDAEACLNGIFLQTFLRYSGIYAEILSQFELSENDANLIRNSKCKVFAISTTFVPDWSKVKKVSQFIKKYCPEAIIIVGGPLAFLLKISVDKESRNKIVSSLSGLVNAIITEENGELSLLCILQNIFSGNAIDQIPGMISPIKNDVYFYNNSDTCHLNTHFIDWSNVFLPENINTVAIETSRGCMFKCKYCSYSKFHAYKENPLELLRKEIRSLKGKEGVKYISFVDGTLNGNSKRILDICKILIEEKLNIPWHFMGNVKGLSKQQAMLLAESGCEFANIGIESGSNKLRQLMGKPIENNQQIIESFQNLHDSGVISRGFFFVGFPGETEDTVQETIDLINSMPIDLFRVAIFRPRMNSYIVENNMKYSLEGRGYLWRHYSMDSVEAAKCVKEIFLQTKPKYDPNRGVYELMMEGYSRNTAFQINEMKNKLSQKVNNGIFSEAQKGSYDRLFKRLKNTVNEFDPSSS